jgi:hypothetical protein
MTCSVFFVNGMMNSYTHASKAANDCAQIIDLPVELHHNDTTSTSKVKLIAIKIILGVIGLTYACVSEKQSQGKKILDMLIGIASICAIASGILDIIDIQQRKQISAENLAKKKN